MDRLQAMVAFIAVVDSGGFARAARIVGLSAPVVTRAVAELEARVGARLLVRTTRSVRVTEAGARFAEDCRQILSDLDAAEGAVASAVAAPRGSIAITAPVLFGETHVTPVVVRYLQAYPEVDAQCVFADRVVNLFEEGIDVAVRIGALPDSSLRALPVGRVRRVLVASPAYLERAGEPRAPQDLARHAIISATGVTPVSEWRFGAAGRTMAIRVRPRMRTTTNGSALAAACAGLGIARLLSYQVDSALRDGALVRVLDTFEPEAEPVHVLHHEGRRATRKVSAFVELAAAALRADPALA